MLEYLSSETLCKMYVDLGYAIIPAEGEEESILAEYMERVRKQAIRIMGHNRFIIALEELGMVNVKHLLITN